MDRYPGSGDHGMVGDLQTAALIARDGTVDWWCTPRFDSPGVFASLLDLRKGGHWSLEAPEEGGTVRQLHLPDTAILLTRFMGPGGVGEVGDFMPADEGPATDRHRLIRGPGLDLHLHALGNSSAIFRRPSPISHSSGPPWPSTSASTTALLDRAP
ncbi:hypothetical protein GCM10022221_37850 [Actinocorallia aurea]